MKRVEEHLSELIRIPSASSLSNEGVVAYAKAAFKEAGWSCRVDDYEDAGGTPKANLIAAPAGQDAGEADVELAMMCHTDTVPPAAGWERALQPFVQDGVLYGCGACDVKGFLACLLAAASEIGRDEATAGVRIVLTADEEVGCLGARRLLASGRLRPRTLVIGEPTSLHPARAAKGYCLGEMVVRGAEAHSAHPRRGRSAIYDAARVVQAIERLAGELEQEPNSFFDPPYTTLNIGVIQGGSAKNIVPGECRFLVEWRPIPGASGQSVPLKIEAILSELRRSNAGFEASFRVLREQQGFETKADARLVEAMERRSGRSSIAIPFGSEASVFAVLPRRSWSSDLATCGRHIVRASVCR